MQEQWVRTDDGVRLRAMRQGQGQALVLCHGGPGVWDYLGPLASMVDDLAEVWRYDQRGCGSSGGADGPFTIDRFIQDLEHVRSATQRDRWIVGGHSWGATLALLYAVAHPDRVSGLLYVCGTGIEWPRWKAAWHTERDRRLAGNSRFAELSQRKDVSTELGRELLALQWATDYADYAAGLRHARAMLATDHRINGRCSADLNAEVCAVDLERWREQCARLAIPVLIIEGDADPRPRQAVDSLARALPNVERVVVRGSGHYPWLEARDEFRGLLPGWLSAIQML